MPPFSVKALGEIAIRCADIDAMCAWYRDVIGLRILEGGYSDGIVFFEIAQGYGGHTSVLALFRNDVGNPRLHERGAKRPETGATSSLHHLALSLERSDQDKAIAWFTAEKIDHKIEYFGWIGWRGVFLTDPEGNTVELVTYDAAFLDS